MAKANAVPRRKAPGAHSFAPTEQDRRAVELMVRHGIPLEEVRRVIRNPATGRSISKTTLMRHFEREIETGQVKANTAVAESLYRQAVGRARVIVDGAVVEEERPPNTTAAIWWTKARMGWKAGAEEEAIKAGGAATAAIGKVTVYVPDNGRDPPAARPAGGLPRESG